MQLDICILQFMEILKKQHILLSSEVIFHDNFISAHGTIPLAFTFLSLLGTNEMF